MYKVLLEFLSLINSKLSLKKLLKICIRSLLKTFNFVNSSMFPSIKYCIISSKAFLNLSMYGGIIAFPWLNVTTLSSFIESSLNSIIKGISRLLLIILILPWQVLFSLNAIEKLNLSWLLPVKTLFSSKVIKNMLLLKEILYKFGILIFG